MSKEPVKVSAPGKSPGNKPKRKLTRTEKKQIAAAIRQAKGDGKAHTAQQTIPYLMSYVTHSEAGEGLLFYGNVILPFVDRFPKDTELYRVMTTKPEEVGV